MNRFFIAIVFLAGLFGSTQMVKGQSLYFEELYEQIEENPSTALPFVLEYYREVQDLGEVVKESEASYLLGYAYYRLSNLILARKYLQESILRGGHSGIFLSRIHTTLGIVFDLQNRYTDAIEHYLTALKISELEGNKNEIARNLINLGLTYGKLNNGELAQKYLRRSLEISEQLQDTIKIGLYYQNMGVVFYNTSQFDSAIEYNRRAISKFELMGYASGALQCMFNIALVYENRSQFEEALIAYSDILERLDPKRDGMTLANTLIMMGRIYVQRNDLQNARRYTDSAARMVEEGGLYMLREQLYVNQLYLSRSEVGVFKNQLAQLLEVKEGQMQERFMEQIAEMQSVYELEQKEEALLYATDRLIASRKQTVFLIVVILLLVVIGVILVNWNHRLRKFHRDLYLKDRAIASLKPSVKEVVKQAIEEDKQSNPQQKIFLQIMELIEANEHIMNPELNLRDIAKRLGTNELYVSQAVNKIAGKNFSRFLNEFRIDEARNLLTNPDMEHKTMEEIALLSGFSSVNTFYRQFKEQSGLTPTQYKNMHKENPGL